MSGQANITVGNVTFQRDGTGQWLNSPLPWLAKKAYDDQLNIVYDIHAIHDGKNLRRATFFCMEGQILMDWKVWVTGLTGYRYVNDDLLNDWKNGDLLYGTEKMRAIYRSALKLKFGNSVQFVTADEINSHWLSGLSKTNQPLDDVSAEKFSDYGRFLLSYAPNNKNAGRYYPGHEAKLALAHKSWPEGYRTTVVSQPNERRSCKALVKYITITPGRRIHFILTGVTTEQSYTLAEMRFAVKHIPDQDWKRIWFYEEDAAPTRLRHVNKTRDEIRAAIDLLLPP